MGAWVEVITIRIWIAKIIKVLGWKEHQWECQNQRSISDGGEKEAPVMQVRKKHQWWRWERRCTSDGGEKEEAPVMVVRKKMHQGRWWERKKHQWHQWERSTNEGAKREEKPMRMLVKKNQWECWVRRNTRAVGISLTGHARRFSLKTGTRKCSAKHQKISGEIKMAGMLLTISPIECQLVYKHIRLYTDTIQGLGESYTLLTCHISNIPHRVKRSQSLSFFANIYMYNSLNNACVSLKLYCCTIQYFVKMSCAHFKLNIHTMLLFTMVSCILTPAGAAL